MSDHVAEIFFKLVPCGRSKMSDDFAVVRSIIEARIDLRGS